jgi:hypothetical protein
MYAEERITKQVPDAKRTVPGHKTMTEYNPFDKEQLYTYNENR